MREEPRIVYQGYGMGQMLLAMLSGAAAGAAVAYLTAPRSGIESRQRLRALSDDARETVNHVPEALRKATDAAKAAFIDALDDGRGRTA